MYSTVPLFQEVGIRVYHDTSTEFAILDKITLND